MSLRHAALALLAAQPMTGYELVRYFDDTVGLMWAASDSQIYPELRRMEADGLIRAETIPRGERAEKRLYKITPRGRARLRAWTGESLPYPPERDVHRLQITYGEFTSLENVRKHLNEHLDHYTWRRNQWVKLLETIRSEQFPLMRARLDKSRPELRRRIIAFKALALEGQVAHADAEIAWARRGLQLIDDLDRTEAAGTGPRDDS
ncbi:MULTISPECIES: PadR family transcriptional regulator [Actinomadura]|uniref:PadR family transcriptional regulator n=1 Tax=Actinomadura geliboluensis TaxID=882440 RepID=A0A5S4HBJ9_9ACTN|nr:PadR family transcriptional regulator [Actinomadura geliboluensis]TMR42356.1 PadR family transcriptional regulator [Actinomadura geliboluensis]